jgi:hypothetical protein
MSYQYTAYQCKQWLLNPIRNPISGDIIINNFEEFNKLALNTLELLEPIEIYNINIEMYKVLGLDELFEPVD